MFDEVVYVENLRSTFNDFLSHELIAKNPYSLSDREVLDGIKARSNNRPEHRCELINRINRYCTLVKIKGHRSVNYGPNYGDRQVDQGVFTYKYNDTSELIVPYSVFKYPHTFSDEGTVKSSWGGNEDGKSIQPVIDHWEQYSSNPEKLFECKENLGTDLFLEYSLSGINTLGSTHELISLVKIDEGTPGFMDEVRKSLLTTRYLILCLVDKYPYHLMHNIPDNKVKDVNVQKLCSTFTERFNIDVKAQIRDLKEVTAMELNNHNINVNLPF